MVSASQALVCGALIALAVSAQDAVVPQALAVSPQGNVSVQGVPFTQCGTFKNFNWNDARFVCEWMHYTRTEIYYNVFIMTYGGSRTKECTCRSGVSQYNPWGSWWGASRRDNIFCYWRTSDNTKFDDVIRTFDGFDCPDYEDH